MHGKEIKRRTIISISLLLAFFIAVASMIPRVYAVTYVQECLDYINTDVNANSYININASVFCYGDSLTYLNIVNATIELTGSEMLLWINSTNTFSIVNNPNNVMQLNNTACTRTNATYNYPGYGIVNCWNLTWNIQFFSNYTYGWKDVLEGNATLGTYTYADNGQHGTAGTIFNFFFLWASSNDYISIESASFISFSNVNASDTKNKILNVNTQAEIQPYMTLFGNPDYANASATPSGANQTDVALMFINGYSFVFGFSTPAYSTTWFSLSQTEQTTSFTNVFFVPDISNLTSNAQAAPAGANQTNTGLIYINKAGFLIFSNNNPGNIYYNSTSDTAVGPLIYGVKSLTFPSGMPDFQNGVQIRIIIAGGYNYGYNMTYIWIAGDPYWNGTRFYPYGTYSLSTGSFPSRLGFEWLQFLNWTSSGAVAIADPYARTTTLTTDVGGGVLTLYLDYYVRLVYIDLNANLDCGNWMFADERYYNFNLTLGINFDSIANINYSSISFDIPTYNGTDNLTFAYDNGNWTLVMNPLFDDRNIWPARTEIGTIVYSTDMVYASFYFRVWVTVHVQDVYQTGLNVTAYATLGRFLSNITGTWITPVDIGSTTYLNVVRVYSHGGFSLSYWTTGNAGKLAGGDAFEFYANNYSSVYNEMVFHNLQHIKMNPEVSAFVGYQSYLISFGIDYCNNSGTWLNEIRIDVAAINISYANALGGGEVFICYEVSWYQRGSWIKTDTIYMFVHGEAAAVGAPFNHRIWFDFWFNILNGSTTIGGRVNAYEYPMKDNAAPYLKWLSTNWGVRDDVAKDSMCMLPILDDNGNIISVSQIKLMKVWAELYVAPWTTNQTAKLSKYEVMDLTFGQTPLVGILTPSFDETKVPTMQQGGLMGFLASALTDGIKYLSDNVIFGGLGLWPMFVAFIDTIAGWMGFPHGFSNAMTWLVNAWSWLSSSMGWIVALFPPIFSLLGAVLSKFITLLIDAATYWVQMVTYATNFFSGAYTSGVNFWTDFNMSQWIILLVILYPFYLIIVWDEEGLDAVIGQLTFLFGILSMLASFFLTIIRVVISVISWIIESIPVVE